MRQGIVIDTNVLVNAIRRGSKPNGMARRFMRDVYLGKYTVYVSSEVMSEYKDVLSRKQAKSHPWRKYIWFAWINTFGISIEPKPTTQEQVEMKDESDRIFFDLAKCMHAKLVTRNRKHYPIHEIVTSLEELYG